MKRMAKTKILIVEDENIVAKDIQNTLSRLGYEVPATASSAGMAFEKLEEVKPDLVFLDIRLKGDVDGIQIAERIKTEYDIPVIFLTSYTDKNTLDRAKVTEPYGYLVKPFNEPDLQSTIEMALYKFQKDHATRADKNLYAKALSHLSEAVIITDIDGKVNFLNQKAESLTGAGSDAAAGKDISTLIKFECSEAKLINQVNYKHLISQNKDFSFERVAVTAGKTKAFEGSLTSSPVQNEKNQLIGCAFVVSEQSTSDGTGKEAAPPLPFDNLVIQDSFFVKKSSMLVKVYLENIQWIQAMDNYVIIQTTTDQFIIHSTMRDIEMKLPSKKFLRVHRSYIIPIEKISVLDENTVKIGDKTIPVGKSYKDAFMERLNFL